ncbi:hypothetical protein RI367_005088 [Sorochytrium milnesiophthora]
MRGFRIRKGAGGGFVTASPTLLIELLQEVATAPASIKFWSNELITSAGGGATSSNEYQHDAGVESAVFNALFDRMQSALLALPTEEPRGSEDIYGLDTQIMLMDDSNPAAAERGLLWANQFPEGCAHNQSSCARATEAHKQAFANVIKDATDTLTRVVRDNKSCGIV